MKVTKKLVPKGLSKYQASWLDDEEDEEEEEDDDDDFMELEEVGEVFIQFSNISLESASFLFSKRSLTSFRDLTLLLKLSCVVIT